LTTLYIVDEFTLIFLIVAPSLTFLVLFALFFKKMPRQAKALIVAWLRKRDIIAKRLANGMYDFFPSKLKDRYLWVKKDEVYDILKSANPTFNARTQLAGTSITFWLASGQALAATPQQIEDVEQLSQVEGDEVPEELKKALKERGVDVDAILKERREVKKGLEKARKEGKDVGALPILKVTILDTLFPKVPDLSARRVLNQVFYNMGLKDAEKRFDRLGLIIGLCVIVGLSILAFILIGGGAV